MARKTKKDVAQEVWNQNEYLKQVLSHIPEDQQPGVFEYLGEHVMLRSEAQRLMDEAKQTKEVAEAHKANMDAWYAANQKLIADSMGAQTELERLRAAVAGGGGEAPKEPAAPAVDTSKFVPREDAEKMAQQVAQQAWLNSTAVTRLGIRHYKEFGEELDIDKLTAHAQQRRLNLEDAWRDLNHDQLEEKSRAKELKDREALRKQIEDEVRQKYSGSASPYPIPSNTEPSTLEGLKQSDKSNYGVNAAITEYNRLVAGKSA